MHTDRYIPTEFTCTNYEYTKQNETYYHSELSFVGNNNKMKYHKDSKKDSDYYKNASSTEYKNTPSSNFKISDTHYINLDYFSVVDGVMIEDSRGFVIKISNANFIQLARECTIRNGIIEDECIIGFDKNCRPTLVKVNSDFHKEVIKYTSKQNYNFKEEELVQGKVYKFKTDKHRQYMYLGKHKIKTKRDSHYFSASIVQPKVPQHVFVYVYNDGSVSDQFTSSKLSSIQEEVKMMVKTKFDNIMTRFKNGWQGRVIKSVAVSSMTKSEKEKIRNEDTEKYVVMKYPDGSYHLGVTSRYNFACTYICPLDSDMMPTQNERMKKGIIINSREEEISINNSDNEWYYVSFKFEDPLSINF